MAANPALSLQVQLTEDQDPDQVTVDLSSFVEFDNEMNHRLEQLVDQWSHFAAPRATRQNPRLT